MKVTVCIPTYNRPDFLKQAIDSCLSQTLLPYEIIIGDDSNDDKTEEMMASLQISQDVMMSYHHHTPSLKQTENTNFLFNHAQGDKVVLLHDDDLLLPEAIETMVRICKEDPSIEVVYGKQYLMSDSGEIKYDKSPQLNEAYFRSAAYEGSKLSPIEAGLIQQFPNNGFMMDTALARRVPWRKTSEIGDTGNGTEMDWSIRIGLAEPKMYFVNKYLALYRLSEVSMSQNSDDSAFKAYLMLERLNLEPKYSPIQKLALKRKTQLAIRQALFLNKTKDAFRIFFSKYHTNFIWTKGYYKSLFLLVLGLFKNGFTTSK
ncbi:glycosyltransferase family 2 protein [Mariniflexile sp.]|uniref:glycosyltransferase family 2 protein n=1 Tax=Mariniflexile sp. TaxID=1979402 RepID=UPI003563CC19